MTSRRNRRHSSKRFFNVFSIISVGILVFWGIFVSDKEQVKQIENVKSDVVLAKTLDEATLLEEKQLKETEIIAETPAEVIATETTNQYVDVAAVDNTINYTETANYTYDTTSYVASNATYSTTTLANGNTAGEIGSYAAAQMAAATGVAQETWEYIIARESNGDPSAANASGASGLFQTIPGWGSTATVEDQIQAALNAYNSQGLSAWGY